MMKPKYYTEGPFIPAEKGSLKRRRFSLLFFLLPLCSFARQPSPDVISYQFSITLSDISDTIVCSAVINMDVPGGSAIDLDLISKKANGKGMRVQSVIDEISRQPLNYTHSGDVLHISNPGNEQHRTIRVDYLGIPADGLIITKNKYDQRTFFSDNWPNRGRNWLVCHDHPSDKAPVDFIVTAPARYQVVSNGVQIEETNLNDQVKLTHWHESTPLPVKVMGIGVAEFAVGYAGDAMNVPVYSWVYPADREKGFYDYGMATQPLAFFIRNIGPFPYKKLANVESKTIFGGMENAGAIFYSESSITGKGKAEELIAHEEAHQWFGDMATEADWPHLWLSEGFATYFSLLYLENKYGSDTLTKQLKANRNKVIRFYRERPRPVVDSTVTDYMQLLNVNSYEKGAWILHMLRRQLGDSTFWKGIRNYYNTYAGKNATTADLEKIFEEVSGKDLGQFFRQWLYTAGHPILHITHTYTKKTLVVTVTQQQDYLFQFPLTIVIRGNDVDITKGIRVNDRSVSFSVPMDSEPTAIIIDPLTALLFEEK